jgi:hypothetical protein
LGNLEKHFVKEELVILENINDSSGTPGDFQFLQNPGQAAKDGEGEALNIQEEPAITT